MRSPRLKLNVRLLMALVALAAVGAVGARHLFSESFAFQSGYAQGRLEAEQQLQSGTAALYGGRARPGDYEWLDRETGLPFEIIDGNEFRGALAGRAIGRNDRIYESIRANGVPANSFKPWFKDIFDLPGFFDRRDRIQPPIPLAAGGPPVQSPDGKTAITLVKRFEKHPKPGMSERLGLSIVAGKVVVPMKEDAGPEDTVDLHWGPNGSGFVVVRFTSKDGRVFYDALDLRRGDRLRSEERIR